LFTNNDNPSQQPENCENRNDPEGSPDPVSLTLQFIQGCDQAGLKFLKKKTFIFHKIKMFCVSDWSISKKSSPLKLPSQMN
jgi:hypothetical protein